jgi:hypothetical protein
MSIVLDDDQVALARAQSGLVKAQRLFNDEKTNVDRLKSAGKDARDGEQTLGLLEIYVTILERHRDNFFATTAGRLKRLRER